MFGLPNVTDKNRHLISLEGRVIPGATKVVFLRARPFALSTILGGGGAGLVRIFKPESNQYYLYILPNNKPVRIR